MKTSLPSYLEQQASLYRLNKARLLSGKTGALSDQYQFYGSNQELQESNDPEVLMSGPAGTGKSLAALTKLHRLASHWRWARILIVRKTRVSLTDSGLVTFERFVLGEQHPLVLSGPTRANRHSYVYTNGSEIVVGGMDNPTRVMSTEWDVIYIQEAIELQQIELESLKSRLRNNRIPVQQIIADTNPGPPMHWIKQRCDNGLMRMIYCTHEDNPTLYDREAQQWTPFGIKYIQTLDNLSGVMKDRLRFGKWVQAEGSIYDNFDPRPGYNVTEEAEYDPAFTVRWGVDDGYVRGQGPGSENYHPRVILFANITPQGFIHIFDEYYATGELSEVSIQNAIDKPYKRPEIAYVDSSAKELIARLWLATIQATGATHPVGEGIKNLRRFICDPNGVRTLKIHPRCINLIREMVSYRYDEHSHNSTAGERKPLKVDDHGPDALRYLLWSSRFNS